MAQGNLLEIYYDRIISTTQIILTTENCATYGYTYGTIKIQDVDTIVFYDITKTIDEYVIPNENGESVIDYHTYQRHTHIAPPCSKYDISFADVDKEGSGRNSLTGEMFRERIGKYFMLTISWDLIPNTKEYNNWYRILTHLPPFVYLKLLMPNGTIEEKKMYRGDVNTRLYWFVENQQMWQGLSTTFTQWDIDEYDDTYEPEIIE